MKWIVLFLTLIFITKITFSSTIAIIDSGTDIYHEELFSHAWINPVEIADNNRDEDRNGYQDDIFGWNFAEDNNQIIDYKYLDIYSENIVKFFEIQAKIMLEQATVDEMNWINQIIQDDEFIKRLTIYGNFMHGTHVAGIAARNASKTKILSVKLIPTEVGKFIKSYMGEMKESLLLQKDFRITLVKKILEELAASQATIMEDISYYIHNHQAAVANGSFGTGYPRSEMIAKAILDPLFAREVTREEIADVAKSFLAAMIRENVRMVNAAPDTLFVFAAGNDGLNNDIFPASPTNILANNVISVAATIDRSALAPFSNYGPEMVDVAAPGFNILSTVPGNNYLRVSGTSQAAPYVANIAGEIKSINSSLTPFEIKKIIMSSVDTKLFLEGKVKTAGIVNKERALKAATFSIEMSLDNALAVASVEVLDVIGSIDYDGSRKYSMSIFQMISPITEEFILP